jgi:hypothetical protein
MSVQVRFGDRARVRPGRGIDRRAAEGSVIILETRQWSSKVTEMRRLARGVEVYLC